MRALVTLLAALALYPVPTRAQDAAPGRTSCASDDRFRAFDFWVGEWQVTTPDGKTAGENRVDLILGDCVLQENWSGAGGSTGKSFNYLDAKTGRWHQVWVDGVGGHMQYEGSFTDGAMRFEGRSVYPNGRTSQMRMSFTPMDDGRVRQYIEESLDNGATWAVWFDGYYARMDR